MRGSAAWLSGVTGHASPDLRRWGLSWPRRYRQWVLPGLAAALFIAGALFLVAGCGTRQLVSTIPPDITTTTPAVTAAPPSSAPASPAAAAVKVPPVRIVIPAIHVDAPVMQLGLNADRTVQVPPLENHNLAGWYKYDASPGQLGAAVIIGHIDSYTGASVFYNLRYLTHGDTIMVTLAGGKVVTFAVDSLQQTLKTSFPASAVYGTVSYAGLRLVTCGGVFNPAAGSYESSIIIYAHMVA